MKRKMLALLATVILTFAYTVNCFAAPSPIESVLPTSEETTSYDGTGGATTPSPKNPSSTSPKTGVNLAFGFIAVISAAGVALVSKKKYSEAE